MLLFNSRIKLVLPPCGQILTTHPLHNRKGKSTPVLKTENCKDNLPELWREFVVTKLKWDLACINQLSVINVFSKYNQLGLEAYGVHLQTVDMIFNHKAKIAGGAWTSARKHTWSQHNRSGQERVMFTAGRWRQCQLYYFRVLVRVLVSVIVCVRARVRMIQQPEQRWCVGHSHSSGAITEPNTQTADFYSRRDLQRIV